MSVAVTPIVTLPERKRREAARRAEAARAIVERLRLFIEERPGSGRFIVFGSVAIGTARHDSDIDILIDVAPERETEAWKAVESACSDLRMPADILSTAKVSDEFVAKIMARPVQVIG